jgi:hypothetical protein
VKENYTGGILSTHSRDEKCLKNFGGNPEAKRLLGGAKRKWEYIRMVIREVGGNLWIAFIWLRIRTNDEVL